MASPAPTFEPFDLAPPLLDPEERTFSTHPGARPPDRRHWLLANGVKLAISEWGAADDPPVLLAHGGFDFAATFSGFAPRLADAGLRVVTWDQRGHGDSAHVPLYSWDADVRDALAVLDATTRRPIPFVGHSKGGAVLTQLAQACPHRVSHLANLDGLPSRTVRPDIADHERTKLLATEVASWLDHRRASSTRERQPGTLEDLARRRGRMNPRLSHEWLCYIAIAGARKDPDGWRWKIDPTMRFGGFGPWRPDWTLRLLPGLAAPLLGLLASQREPMGFETTVDDLAPYLPYGARIEALEDCGHFIHIEQPKRVADLVLEFIS